MNANTLDVLKGDLEFHIVTNLHKDRPKKKTLKTTQTTISPVVLHRQET